MRLLLLFIFLTYNALGQNEGMLYIQKVNEAFYLYKAQKFLDAAHKYTEAFDLVKKEKIEQHDKYNAACNWILADKKTEGFVLLTELIKEDGYSDLEHLKKDRDFISIHQDSQWKELIAFLENVDKQTEDIKLFYTLDRTLLETLEVYASEVLLIDGRIVNMIPFRVENLWGFVDKSDVNKQLIPPSFTHVHAVYKEGAVVSKTSFKNEASIPEREYGLIDDKGNYLIPPKYQKIYKEGDLYHAMTFLKEAKTLNGRVTLPIEKEDYNPYTQFACVLNDYYNEKGELLFSEKATDFVSFKKYERYAWFRFGNRISIRDQSGNLVKQFLIDAFNFQGIYDNLLVYLKKEANSYVSIAYTIDGEEKWKKSDDLMQYKLSSHLYARVSEMPPEITISFLDTKNNKQYEGFFFEDDFSIPEDYWQRSYFRVSPLGEEAENLPNAAMGVINRKGELIIGYNDKRLSPFVNGWMYVDTQDENCLFLNQDGDSLLLKGVSLPLYSGIYRSYYAFGQMGFYEDWCVGMNWSSSSEPNFYYFDKEGNKVLELPTDITFAGHFSDGMALAIKNQKIGFINKKGIWVIEPIYPFSVVKEGAIGQVIFPEFKEGYAYLAGKGYINKNGQEFFSEKKK